MYPPPEKFLVLSGKALFTLIVGLLLYAAANQFVLAYKGIPMGTGYNGLHGVGQYAGFSIPALLKDTYLYPFSYLFHPQTYFSRLAPILVILSWLVGLFCLIGLIRKHALRTPSILLIVLLILLMPLGANAVYFISKGMVHTLMIYAFFLTAVFPISLLERAIQENALTAWSKPLCSRLALCAFSLTFLSNLIFCNQLYLKRDLEYQSTLSLFTRVIDRVEQVDGYQPGYTPVTIVGTLFDSPLFMDRSGFEHFSKIPCLDNIFSTTANYSINAYVWQILSYPLNLVSNADFYYREDVLAMPAFPAKGSCQMIDGTMVIRLGNRSVAD